MSDALQVFVSGARGAPGIDASVAANLAAIDLSNFAGRRFGVPYGSAARSAVVAGSDITSGLQGALNSGATQVVIPEVLGAVLSGTIVHPNGVDVVGAGSLKTQLRSTGDYGDKWVCGVSGGGFQSKVGGFTLYHDHGNGFFPNNNPATFVNPITHQGSAMRAYGPQFAEFSDLKFGGMTYQLYVNGGAFSTFNNVYTYGIWDPQNPILQETVAGLLIDGDASGLVIPTCHAFTDCGFNGTYSQAPRTISWPAPLGSPVQPTTFGSANIGPQVLVQINMCEGLSFTRGYIGAASGDGMRFLAASNKILTSVTVTDTFMDSNGGSMFQFDNLDAGGTCYNITLRPSISNDEFIGFAGVSDIGNTGTNGSVINLSIDCAIEATIGPGIYLQNARGVRINSDVRAFNAAGLYTGDGSGRFNSAAYLVGSKYVRMRGGLGGDTAYSGAVADSVNGVVYSAAAPGVDVSGCVNWGLSGALSIAR